jgi:hypothetical protein
MLRGDFIERHDVAIDIEAQRSAGMARSFREFG